MDKLFAHSTLPQISHHIFIYIKITHRQSRPLSYYILLVDYIIPALLGPAPPKRKKVDYYVLVRLPLFWAEKGYVNANIFPRCLLLVLSPALLVQVYLKLC